MVVTNQKVRTSVYLDKELKNEAKKLFEKFHINLSDAINLFLSQSVLEQGLPFRSKIPNDKTVEAMQNIRDNKDLEEVSLEQLKNEMQKCVVD